MLMKIAGIVRGLSPRNHSEDREDAQIAVTNRGDQCVVQGLPPLAEIVRLGNSWQVRTTTPFAALTTEPTTTAAITLWNAESQVGMACVIDSICVYERVVDTTQQNQLALFALLNTAQSTALAGTALVFRSLCGRADSPSCKAVAGATVVDDGWFAHGPTTPNAAAVAGGAWRVTDIDLKGMYIVPPGRLFSLHCAKIAGTASQINACIRFHMAQIHVAV